MAFTIPNAASAAYPPQAQVHQADIDIQTAGFNQYGVFTTNDCIVAPQGGNMVCTITAGNILAGTQYAIITATTVTLTTDPTNPRFYLVVVNGAGVVSTIAGTAAPSPIKPTIDTSQYVALAEVYLPPATTVITGAMIVDKRISLQNPGALEAIGRIDVLGHSLMAEGGASDLDKGSMHKLSQFFPARFRNNAWGGAIAMLPGLPTTAQASGVGTVRAGWGHCFYQYQNHQRTPTFDTAGNPIAIGVGGKGGNTTLSANIATNLPLGTQILVGSTVGFAAGQPVILRQAAGGQLDEINYVSAVVDATHIQLYRNTANAYSTGDAMVTVPDFWSCERQLVLLEYDGIDASWMGMTTWSSTFPEVYRAIIARMRCAAHFDIDCKLIRNTAGTVPTKTSVADGYGSGSDPNISTAVAREMTTTSTTTILQCDIQSNFEANSAIVLFFKTKANGDGALWTYSVDGGANSTKETRAINGFGYNNNTGTRAANGVEMPSVAIIRGLAAGKHVVTLQPTAITGTATFMGYGIIGAEPPPMIVEYPNRLFTYNILFGAPNYVLTDADIPTMKTAIAALLAEFTPTDPGILTLDRDAIINKDVGMFDYSGVHCNDRGHFEVANGIVKLINSSYISPRAIAKCSPVTTAGWYPVGAFGDAGGYGVNFASANWNNAGTAPTEFYKSISEGFVELRGEIYHNAPTDPLNSVILTFPKGHRPKNERYFNCTGENGTVNIIVRPNGDVVCGSTEERGFGQVGISLSGIIFRADQ